MGGQVKFDFRSNFDEQKILTPAEKAERKILMGFGGYVRAVARRSIKKGGPFDRSYDGQPPVGHANELYRNFLAFGYDEKRHEVSIGSALLTGTRGDVAPEKIEYGGTERVIVGNGKTRRAIVARYTPRPAMRLAYEAAVKKFLPQLIENSITP